MYTYGDFHTRGYPKLMVYFMENPNRKGVMTGGTPIFRKPQCSNPWEWWNSWKPGSCWGRITYNILETLFYLFWGCYTLISTCPDLSCARRALQCANAARKVCLGESLGHGVHEKLPRTWSKTVEHLSNMLVYPMINHQTSHILIVYTSHLGGKTAASWPRAADLLVSELASCLLGIWLCRQVEQYPQQRNGGSQRRSVIQGHESQSISNPEKDRTVFPGWYRWCFPWLSRFLTFLSFFWGSILSIYSS